jgi:hypothetical protein
VKVEESPGLESVDTRCRSEVSDRTGESNNWVGPLLICIQLRTEDPDIGQLLQ